MPVPACAPRSPDSRGGPATIAFVHRGADWISGAEQCLLDLATRLDRQRFRPVVLSNAPALARECTRCGVLAYEYPGWGNDPNPGPSRTASFQRIRDLLHQIRPDLVHANMTTAIPGIIPVARRLRVPIVAHLHMPLEDRWWRLHDFIHQASAAVGVAQHVLTPLAADGMRKERLRLIHNGVAADRLADGDATGLRAELGVPDAATVALSIGSLIWRKAHDVSIRAVAVARERGHDVRLLICGTGEQERDFRELVAKHGVGDAVHFLGYRGDVGAIMRDAADVLAASARAEALPLNVLEAQWEGLPVVASDIPAHHEAMVPDHTGLLVPVNDVVALADAICAFATDRERRRAYGRAGVAFARAHFGMDRYIDAFDALYTELLAKPRSHYGWLRGTAWPREYTRWTAQYLARRVGLMKPPPPRAAEFFVPPEVLNGEV
jgi:glycosyltransferase involved in cell wall biosynthesis